MTIRDGLSDLYHWWRWELGKMLDSRRSNTLPQAMAVLRIRRDGALVETRRRGKRQAESVLADDPERAVETLKRLLPRLRTTSPGVSILIEPERYLKRRLSPMRLPRRRMRAMAALDLEAATPFEASDVLQIFPQYDEEAPECSYYIVKKSQLSPLFAELKKSGFLVSEILLLDDERTVAPDAESFRQIIKPPLKTTIFHRVIAGGGALALLGLALTVGHAHWRYWTAEAELDRLIAIAETDVTQVRSMIAARNRKIAQISAVRNEKKGAVPLVSILEEMSHVIPDTTWLTDIEVDGDTVTFTGFSASAAALISVLEASPLFRSPTFNAPIVRVGNQDGERFTINMTIESADG